MSLGVDRFAGLRWLLLSAISAGGCGGSTDGATRGGDAGSDAGSTGGPAGSSSSEAAAATAGASSGASGDGSSGAIPTTGGDSAGGVAPTAGAGGEAQAGSGGKAVTHGQCTEPTTTRAGFVTCSGGAIHRESKVACDIDLPQEPVTCGVAPNTYTCDGTKRERCGVAGGGPPPTACDVACVTDSDCGTNQICWCNAGWGTCVNAACTVDADCGVGYFCRWLLKDDTTYCNASNVFQCELDGDTCTNNAECLGLQRCQSTTLGDPVSCLPSNSFGCGRPYLIHGTQRLACVTMRSDWAARLALDASGLDAATREALAAGWCALGVMEHASIAAFARFTLQLLGLGAPAALIVESNQAIADETRHARLCFGVAAAFGCVAAGPGALDSHGALDRRSLKDVVVDTFLEGCIGETLATLEASEGAMNAEFSSVREVLEQVTMDEARHASLAWRFVAWGVAQQPELACELRACFEQELSRSDQASPATVPALALARGGLVDKATRLKLRRAALHELVAPCLAAVEQLRGAAAQPAHVSL